jgi:hypothetical protein
LPKAKPAQQNEKGFNLGLWRSLDEKRRIAEAGIRHFRLFWIPVFTGMTFSGRIQVGF